MKKILLLTVIVFSAGAARCQWINQNALLGYEGYLFDVETPDGNTVWGTPFKRSGTAVVYTADFIRTIDNGNTWTKGTIAGTNLFSNIWPIDANTCYAAMHKSSGAGGGVYKTTNGGTSWTQVGTNMFLQTASYCNSVCFFDAKNGVALGDPAAPGSPIKYEIYTTSDSGNTWVRVPYANLPPIANTSEYGITNLFTSSQGHIWFGSTYGYLYHSADMGFTWTKSSTDFPALVYSTGSRQDISDIAFTDSLNGIVTQLDTSRVIHIRKTNDGGMTWTDVTHTGPLYASDFDAVPGTRALISSGSQPAIGFGTSFSMDYGTTWVAIDTGASHTAVDFFNNSTGWTGEYLGPTAVAGGAWAYSGAPLEVIIQFAATKETQVFPNPSSGAVHVIAASESRTTSFTVYDLQGKNVYSETVETLPMYNRELNLNGLAPGVYVLRISDGKITSQHKLIIH